MYISGKDKFDLILGPTTITTALTSNYVDLSKYEKVIFIAQTGTMTSTEGMALSILQAKTSTGSGSVALGVYSTINGTPGVAGQVTKVVECVLNGTSEAFGLEGGTVVLNGITYTFDCSSDSGYTTASFNATRTVVGTTAPAAGCSNEPWKSLHHFAAYVNHGTWGVPGVVAIVGSASTNVTLYANDHIGEGSITCLPSIGDTGIFINKAIGTVECKGAELATSSDFNFVALQSSAVGAAVVEIAALAVRSGARFSPMTTDLYAYDFGV